MSNSINKLVVCNFTNTKDFSFHKALIERVENIGNHISFVATGTDTGQHCRWPLWYRAAMPERQTAFNLECHEYICCTTVLCVVLVVFLID